MAADTTSNPPRPRRKPTKGTKKTDKQRLFVEHYLRTWNASEAARQAGYKGSFRQIGSENLSKPAIRAQIEERLAQAVMGANEALARLTEQARGFDPADYIALRDVYATGKDGEVYLSGVVAELDLERLRADGYGHLIKSIRNTASGPVFEFYDVQAALQLIGRHHGAFLDRSQLDARLTVETPYSDDELLQQARAIIAQRAGNAAPDS